MSACPIYQHETPTPAVDESIGRQCMLLENGDRLITESGDPIVLEPEREGK